MPPNLRLLCGCSPFKPRQFFHFAGAKLSPLAWFGTTRFWPHVFPPHVIWYADAPSFLRHFSTLRTGGFSCFFCGLICRRFAASRPSIWALIARSLNRRFPACCTSIISGFRRSILAGLNFPPCRSGGSGILYLVQGFLCEPSTLHSVNSLTSFLHCCGKFRQISGSFNRHFKSVIN